MYTASPVPEVREADVTPARMGRLGALVDALSGYFQVVDEFQSPKKHDNKPKLGLVHLRFH